MMIAEYDIYASFHSIYFSIKKKKSNFSR